MKKATCVAFGAFLLILASPLGASAGQRRGFTLGIGLGVGYLVESEYSLDRAVSPSANFKIGYAPSNTLEISLTSAALGIYAIYDDADYYFGVSAIALTKYFRPEGPGFFVTGGVGYAYKLELGNVRSRTGLGLIGGVGYCLSKRWSVQGDVVYTNVDTEDYAAIRLTLNLSIF